MDIPFSEIAFLVIGLAAGVGIGRWFFGLGVRAAQRLGRGDELSDRSGNIEQSHTESEE